MSRKQRSIFRFPGSRCRPPAYRRCRPLPRRIRPHTCRPCGPPRAFPSTAACRSRPRPIPPRSPREDRLSRRARAPPRARSALRDRLFAERGGRADRRLRRREFKERLDTPRANAEHDRGERNREQAHHRHPVERPGLHAGGDEGGNAVRLRGKDIVDAEVMAARAPQPADAPGVDDLDFARAETARSAFRARPRPCGAAPRRREQCNCRRPTRYCRCRCRRPSGR